MATIGLTVSSVGPKQVNGLKTLALNALDKRKDRAVRQLYLQTGRRALIFTLSCPTQELLRLTGELPFLLKGLTLGS